MTTMNAPTAVAATTFRERVATFGERDALVGVLTLPATPRPDAPFVVLINSGIIHRVGAHRSYVTFARTFAAAGIPVLRFDLSGIGDSERPGTTLPLGEVVRRDIAAALDFLAKRHGTKRFVLAGLCSGAFDAFDFSLTDDRIVGACLIDMPGPFRNWSYFAIHAASRVLRPEAWANLARRAVGPTKPRPELANAAMVERPGVRGQLSREHMERSLDTLLNRGARLVFLFTGGVEGEYNHRHQFRFSFPRAAAHPLLKSDFIEWSDHTFSTKSARDHVATYLRDWLLESAG